MAQSLRLHGGYYDLGRKVELESELASVEPHSDVFLDLAATEHLDCSCLGLMIVTLHRWRNQKPDTNLRLLNVLPGFAKVLSILRLDEVFVVEAA